MLCTALLIILLLPGIDIYLSGSDCVAGLRHCVPRQYGHRLGNYQVAAWETYFAMVTLVVRISTMRP